MLFEGEGHRFPFDFDAWSTKGLGPELDAGGFKPPTNYEIVQNDGSAVFGYGYLKIKSGFTLTWDSELPRNWTILYRRNLLSTPEAIAVRSDGGRWSDGVRDDGGISIPELAVAGGAFSLSEGEYDELLVFPGILAFEFIEQHQTGGRPFSNMPYLRIDGDLVGNEERVVKGETENQRYVQHGQAVGAWRNNDRTVPVSLADKKLDRFNAERSVVPWAGYLLDSNYLAGASLEGHVGALPAATRVGGTPSQPGPFDFRESWTYSGASNHYVDLPSELSQGLVGATKASILAFVRFTDNPNDAVIVQLPFSGGTEKLTLQVEGTAPASVKVLARAAVGDTLKSATASGDAQFTETDGLWHLIGCWVDFNAGEFGVLLDDKEEITDGITFDSSVFTDDGGVGTLASNSAHSGNRHQGDIANALFFRRRVSTAEVRKVLDLARRGVLF